MMRVHCNEIGHMVPLLRYYFYFPKRDGGVINCRRLASLYRPNPYGDLMLF
jgi:hypothetical protein